MSECVSEWCCNLQRCRMPITVATLKAAFPAFADPELEYKDDRLQTICDGLTKAGYNSIGHFQKTGTRQTLEKAEFSPADIEILVPGVSCSRLAPPSTASPLLLSSTPVICSTPGRVP